MPSQTQLISVNLLRCITTSENNIHSTMSTGLLFVTAPEADHKLINLLLMRLRDWEYGGGQDRLHLMTTKNAYDLDPPAMPLRSGTQEKGETSPPLPSSLDNAWAGATLEDVEAFCIDLKRNDDGKGMYNKSLFVVVDSTDVRAQTCILGERAIDEEADTFTWLDKFNKMRIPWDDLYVTWCNLDIANMNFDEFTHEDGDENGWFTYREIGDDLSEGNQRKRDREIQRFRDAGHI